MNYRGRRLEYVALQDKRCENCGVVFDFNELTFERSDDRVECEYSCPECYSIHKITIDDNDDRLVVEIRGEDGKMLSTSYVSEHSLLRRVHPASEFVDGFYELHDIKDILEFNYN